MKPGAELRALAVALSRAAKRAAAVARVIEAQSAGSNPAPARERRPRTARHSARPDSATIGERYGLWAEVVTGTMNAGGPALTKTCFAELHSLSRSEFCRWLSAKDGRGIPAGSVPDVSIRRALQQALAELRQRGGRGSLPTIGGTPARLTRTEAAASSACGLSPATRERRRPRRPQAGPLGCTL